MNNWATRIFPWLLLTPAVLALFYVDGLLYPHVTLKTLLFRSSGVIGRALFSYLALSGYSFYWERIRSKLTWIPGALLFVAYITSIFGVDFYSSFWSTFSRGDGLLTLSTGVIFFYLTLLYADRAFFYKLLKTVAWVGGLVAIYAFLQWVQVISSIDMPGISETRGRIGGTFGNAAFLAGYLSMTLLATLALIKDTSNRWRRVIQASVILQLLVILLTATRGTILALLIVGIIALVYASVQKKKEHIRKYARAGLFAGVLVASLFFMFRAPLSESQFEPVSRLASISFEDATVASRLFVWKEVFDEAMKSPLLGYGAEHVDVLFDRVYDPDKIIEQWFDRSHNTFLDYFVQYGVLGLVFYILVIFTLGFTGLRMWRTGDSIGLYIIAMASVYAIQNFFVFDTAMTLWLLFAMTASVLAISGDSSTVPVPKFTNSRLVGSVLAVLIASLTIPVAILPLRANMFLAEGYKYHISEVEKSINKMEEGLSLGTYADLEYGYQAYVMYTERQVNMLDGEERVKAYQYAKKVLTDNSNKYPYDARTATYLAHVIDLAPPEVVRDEELLINVLNKAIELSPKRTQLWFMKANIAIRKGETSNRQEKERAYEEAVAILEEYTKLVPENAESRYILANLYLANGDRDSAAYWAEEGLSLYSDNIDTANRAMSYYIAVEDWVNAMRFSKYIVDKTPGNYELMYDLAKLYYLTGDYDKSLELVGHIRQDKPGLIETDPAFLRAIEEIDSNSL